MRIGIPKETRHNENRVGLTPFGVSRLTTTDRHESMWSTTPARAVTSPTRTTQGERKDRLQYEEVFHRADLICRVGRLSSEEVAMLRPGATLCGFLHLAVMPKDQLQELRKKQVTLIATKWHRTRRAADPSSWRSARSQGPWRFTRRRDARARCGRPWNSPRRSSRCSSGDGCDSRRRYSVKLRRGRPWESAHTWCSSTPRSSGYDRPTPISWVVRLRSSPRHATSRDSPR